MTYVCLNAASSRCRLRDVMLLFLRSPVSGLLSLDVSPSDSTKSLLDRLEGSDEGCYLSHEGRLLRSDEILEDLALDENSCLELHYQLAGGAKKRKKKVYTTPKKIKHKRKKVKLATLKFYKVTCRSA